MNDFGYSAAQDRYDNQLPERYDEQPLFKCKCCGDDIFIGEFYYIVANDIYCNGCVTEKIAEREELYYDD